MKNSKKQRQETLSTSPFFFFFSLVIVGIVSIYLLSIIPLNSTSNKSTNPQQHPYSTSFPTTTPPPTLDPGKNYQPKNDLEQISFNAMVVYLEQYKYPKYLYRDSAQESIDDYRINSISYPHFVTVQQKQELRFHVIFSTKIHGNSNFNDPTSTGNGQVSSDGWVVQKSGYVDAKLIDGQYSVEGIATGVGSGW